jgi:hypothetical protein
MNATLTAVGALAALLWLASAVFWAKSASIEIPHNIDTFIDKLREAARWNARAAWSACAAAACSIAIEVLRALG